MFPKYDRTKIVYDWFLLVCMCGFKLSKKLSYPLCPMFMLIVHLLFTFIGNGAPNLFFFLSNLFLLHKSDEQNHCKRQLKLTRNYLASDFTKFKTTDYCFCIIYNRGNFFYSLIKYIKFEHKSRPLDNMQFSYCSNILLKCN